MDERRRFTRTERMTAWLAQDGKSVVSGKPLGPDFHADHRIPWSEGGLTDISNCQALTPEENLKKGSKMPNRFAWQDEFIASWNAHPGIDYFLCALPGAGKTKGSIRAIRLWIERGGVVVVVTPTLPIKRNWRRCMEEVGLFLDENFYGFLREKYCGVVTTYAALQTQSGAFKKFCTDHPVMLICDEIHHCSEHENSSWGISLKESFSLAKRRLLLSGTPVRSDLESTSFLDIEDFSDDNGKPGRRYKMHTCYDWPRALEDRVVRPITFHRMKMEEVRVRFIEEEKTIRSDEDSFLGYAIEEREFALSILRQANAKLTELRKECSVAGAMVVARNIGHARDIYKLLEIIGESPVIVTSDEEEDSLDVIDEFRRGARRWIVSVRQVSEGVDIPRLQILAYLTDYATELAFRQLVGRAVRRSEKETDSQAQAHVFLPDTKKLTKHAEKIEKLQELAFKRIQDGGEPPPRKDRGETVGGSEPKFIGYIIAGKHYVGEKTTIIADLMKRFDINERSASKMLEDPQFSSGIKIGESPEDIRQSTPQESPWVQEGKLRLDCEKLAKQLVQLRQKRRGFGDAYDRKIWGMLSKEVHGEFKVDNTPTEQLSVSQLEKKKNNLRAALLREHGNGV